MKEWYFNQPKSRKQYKKARYKKMINRFINHLSKTMSFEAVILNS